MNATKPCVCKFDATNTIASKPLEECGFHSQRQWEFTKLHNTLADVERAYSDRFEGNYPGQLFGPIDDDILKARKVLKDIKVDSCI